MAAHPATKKWSILLRSFFDSVHEPPIENLPRFLGGRIGHGQAGNKPINEHGVVRGMLVRCQTRTNKISGKRSQNRSNYHGWNRSEGR